ncbi:MAG: glucosamine-6-phosphate deaminase [Oscillospiraceae bacterium]
MKVIIVEDYDKMSEVAADILAKQITEKPNTVLGLATGSTPIGMYKKLVEYYQNGKLNFSEIKSFNLDEYCGLPKDNVQSYWYFMHDNLFNHINIKSDNVNMFDGEENDAKKACEEYDMAIEKAGGIDLQILGCGHNGHIAFNEPSTEFSKSSHRVELQESTINANKRLFADVSQVPKTSYTMGIKNIMNAKKIVMLVSGEDKALTVHQAFNGPIVSTVPASVLQLHNDFTLVMDKAAASKYVK